MFDQITSAPGVDYDAPGYLEQFAKDCVGIDLLWKFERRQSFREPDVLSWVAFDAGDIEKSMQLAEEMRPEIEKAVKAKAYETKRIRVVEEPLTPYLQWEMNILKMRAEAGDQIVVVDTKDIAEYEKESPLPEFVGLGDSVIWHVLYDESGELTGARRVIWSELVSACRNEFEAVSRLGTWLTFSS